MAEQGQFLLVPRGGAGKAVWVPRTHPAASEVRLAEFTGSCAAAVDYWQNYVKGRYRFGGRTGTRRRVPEPMLETARYMRIRETATGQ